MSEGFFQTENGKRKTENCFSLPPSPYSKSSMVRLKSYNPKIAYERGNFVRYKALSAQHTWAYVSNSATEA